MIINGNSSEKMQRCQDYIHKLEKERCKIQVFQRELPLCLELVTQAIETCKQQLSGTTSHEYNSNRRQYECSEETSSDMPVLEEFMPIKRASSQSDDEEKQLLKKTKNNDTKKKDKLVNGIDKNSKKSDWLRSVQLWNNQTSDPPSSSKQDSPRRVVVMEVKKSGAFHPFKKIEKDGETILTPERLVLPLQASASSTVETGGSSGTAGNKEEKDVQYVSQRKSRRCWSPELHRRFLQALHQLGGSHAATPKQIRELMKVDGLTNDEVKSHLQKYRLHTRRPSPSINNNTTTTNSQPPQFLVVGGIWVPPEYATMSAPGTTITTREPSTTQGDRVYAPIATLPRPFERIANQNQVNNSSNSDDRGSHSEGHVQSHSPATSSSRHN